MGRRARMGRRVAGGKALGAGHRGGCCVAGAAWDGAAVGLAVQWLRAGVLAAVHAAFSRDQVGFVNHAQVILITAMPRPLAL